MVIGSYSLPSRRAVFLHDERESKMRRKDRELTEAEAREVLRRAEYGVLSLVTADGAPYAVPMSYAAVGDTIYFHGTTEGGAKMDCMAHDSRAVFTAVTDTQVLPDKFATIYWSAIAAGRMEEITEEGAKTAALEHLLVKYSADYMRAGRRYIAANLHRTAALCLHIETLTGKARKK